MWPWPLTSKINRVHPFTHLPKARVETTNAWLAKISFTMVTMSANLMKKHTTVLSIVFTMSEHDTHRDGRMDGRNHSSNNDDNNKRVTHLACKKHHYHIPPATRWAGIKIAILNFLATSYLEASEIYKHIVLFYFIFLQKFANLRDRGIDDNRMNKRGLSQGMWMCNMYYISFGSKGMANVKGFFRKLLKVNQTSKSS